MRRVRSPVLVGRDAHVATIRTALAAARKGAGGCLVLLGEAGAGKTRLLGEARAEAERLGMACLDAAPSKLAAPPAFGVLAAALRSWTRGRETPDATLVPFGPGLRQVLPEWPGAPVPPDFSADQLRLLILEGAFRLFLQAAVPDGAVMLLDDLQDADLDSLQFLQHAAASAAGAPVLLVAAVRMPEGRPVAAEVAALEARGHAQVLEVGALEMADVGAAVAWMLDASPPPDLVETISTRTGGVPLLVEEAIDAELASGALRVESGHARWSPGQTASVPITTVKLVREKLQHTSQDARRVLAAAAVLERFDPELLAEVAGVPASRIASCLREGESVGLLGITPVHVRFRHALLRDGLVETLLPAERLELHRGAVAGLARWPADDPRVLSERAHHLESVGEADAAATLLVEAGLHSLAGHAPASAEVALTRAVGLARDPEVLAQARAAMAQALGVLGRWEDALRLDRELLGVLGADPERLEAMARNALSAGLLEDAGALIEQARSAGASPGPFASLKATMLLWQGKLVEAIAAADEALSAAERSGDPQLVCRALDVLGRASDALGRRPEAEAFLQRWVAVAEAAGLVSQQAQGLMELGTVEFLAGGPAERLHLARALASRHGLFVTQVLADLSLLWWFGRRGQVGEAIEVGEEAERLCRRFALDVRPHALMALAWARNLAECGAGDPASEEALALEPDNTDLQILSRWIAGESALRSGDVAGAARLLEQATRLMHREPSAVPPPAPFLWIAALLVAGRADDAAAAMPEAQTSPALARQYVNGLWLAVDEAMLAGDEAALEATLERYRESATFDVAVAQVVAAQVIGGSSAVGWLTSALTTFQSHGLHTDAAHARQLLRRMGSPVPRAPRRASEPVLRDRGVTPAERDVLVLLAQGLTNPQIAEALFVSPRTVQSHVSSLLRKVDVGSRATLTAFALSHGLVPTSPPDGG